MTQYITTVDALFFHQLLIRRFGGAEGVRDLGALESALHRPQTGYYDTLIHQAGALMEGLIQSHPFLDGNKRVAFAVVDVFLRINSHSLTADSAAIDARMMSLLEAQTFDVAHLVPWLQDVVRPQATD